MYDGIVILITKIDELTLCNIVTSIRFLTYLFFVDFSTNGTFDG